MKFLSTAMLAVLSIFAVLSPQTFSGNAAQTSRAYMNPGALPAFLQNSPTTPMPIDRVLHIGIDLPLRNTTQINGLVQSFHNPHSPLYKKFLKPQDFTKNFGPTTATVALVKDYLTKAGMTNIKVSSNNLIINADTTVAQAEKAFSVSLVHTTAQGTEYYFPTGKPSVPGSLASAVTNITGLDNTQKQNHFSHIVQSKATPHSGPAGGFTPQQLQTAYDAQYLPFSGSGNIAIFELDGYNPSDIQAFASHYGLPKVHFATILVDGATNTAPGAGALEVSLDMEMVAGMAQYADQFIYIAPNTWTSINDNYNQIATDDIAGSISTSWGLCEASAGNSELSAEDSIFAEYALQGQQLFAASGDSGAYDCNNGSRSVDSPASDPYVIGTGGTALTLNGDNTYHSETAWANPSLTYRSPNGAGGGGGVSSYFSAPAYQTQNGVTLSANRMVPDVSADAADSTPISVYCTVAAAGCPGTGWITVYGTSAAAPLWAALTFDISYQFFGKSAVYPSLLYAFYQYSASTPGPVYQDVVSGNNLYYNAGTGYDLATGIGSPNAVDLLQAVQYYYDNTYFQRQDVGLYNPSTSVFYLNYYDQPGTANSTFNYGPTGATPLAGDWNGKKFSSVGVFKNGVFYLKNTNQSGPADYAFSFGTTGDIPITGDWTGKGYDSVGIYRNGMFYLRNSNTSGPADIAFSFGATGDIPVVGDWTSKGYDTIGVYRPSTGVFYLRNSNSAGAPDISFSFGPPNSLPDVGKWWYGGYTYPGIYTGGTFYLKYSDTGGPADYAFSFGYSGLIPIAGNWLI